jgi:hypothetical protein
MGAPPDTIERIVLEFDQPQTISRLVYEVEEPARDGPRKSALKSRKTKDGPIARFSALQDAQAT